MKQIAQKRIQFSYKPTKDESQSVLVELKNRDDLRDLLDPYGVLITGFDNGSIFMESEPWQQPGRVKNAIRRWLKKRIPGRKGDTA